MSDLGMDQDFNDVETQASLDALPAGTYVLEVVEADCQHNDKANGRRLSVTYRVVSGQYEGRKSWDRFDIDRVVTIKATGEQRQIDRQNYKTLCAALGFTNWPGDASELLGIPFTATAKIEQNDPNYPPKNRWGGYRQATQQQAPVQQQARATATQGNRQPQAQATNRAAPPASQGGSKPPWMNRKAG